MPLTQKTTTHSNQILHHQSHYSMLLVYNNINNFCTRVVMAAQYTANENLILSMS